VLEGQAPHALKQLHMHFTPMLRVAVWKQVQTAAKSESRRGWRPVHQQANSG